MLAMNLMNGRRRGPQGSGNAANASSKRTWNYDGNADFSRKDAEGRPTGDAPSGSIASAGDKFTGAGRMNSSYPPIFNAKPGECYSDWKRGVGFWLAGEGRALPAEVIGPRIMVQLRFRAGKLVKQLTPAMVEGPDGKQIIFDALEKTPLIRQMDKNRIDQMRKKLTSLKRFAGESMASYITRASVYRMELAGESEAMEMGESFYVGHLLDNALLTKRDRALIRSKAFDDSEEQITEAMLDLAVDLEGVQGFPIGMAEPDMPGQLDDQLFMKPGQPSAQQPEGGGGFGGGSGGFRGGDGSGGGSGGFRRFGQKSALCAEEAPGDESLDENDADIPPEVLHAEHEAFAMDHRAKVRIQEVKKMRQYFKSGSAGSSDPEKKQWLQDKQKTEPCWKCKKLGHWSRECPDPPPIVKAHGTLITYSCAATDKAPEAEQAWDTLRTEYEHQLEGLAEARSYTKTGLEGSSKANTIALPFQSGNQKENQDLYSNTKNPKNKGEMLWKNTPFGQLGNGYDLMIQLQEPRPKVIYQVLRCSAGLASRYRT